MNLIDIDADNIQNRGKRQNPGGLYEPDCITAILDIIIITTMYKYGEVDKANKASAPSL